MSDYRSRFACAPRSSILRRENGFPTRRCPGYVKDPVVGIRALDGDRWIEGSVNQENRTVSFEFHTAASLDNVLCDIKLNKDWARW